MELCDRKSFQRDGILNPLFLVRYELVTNILASTYIKNLEKGRDKSGKGTYFSQPKI